MGTGWRKVFCTRIQRDTEVMEDEEVEEKSSRSNLSHSKTGVSYINSNSNSSNSNPCTPRLQSSSINNSPKLLSKSNPDVVQTSLNDCNNDNGNNQKLYCKTAFSNSNTPKTRNISTSPRTILLGSNPSSPRSPFSILKNTLRLSRNNSCGVCMLSVKAGHGMAIYTAECSHTFHFPCIVEFLGKQATLICPICKSQWKDVPLLTIHKLQPHEKQEEKTSPKSLKINYHDDEPLISPKFNPIPEEEDDDLEDGDGEFKGFFVNSKPAVEEHDAHQVLDNMQVSILPESAAVVAIGRAHETVSIVLKIKAPPFPPSGTNKVVPRRAPIDLVSVLDVSGSMNGPKLQMLKRAMRLVISSLGSADRLSIVAFAANPKRLMPLRRMNSQGQRLARQIVEHLVCGSGTCVNEALRKASKILEHRRERNPVATIILLSGGQEENGQMKIDNQQNRSTQSSRTTRFSHIEIPVHSSGFGSESGYNNFQAEDAFSKCVGGLLSVVVQDLRLRLSFASGSNPVEIVAVYSCNGRPTFLGSDSIRVGDLYAEEEKEFLVELRVPTLTIGSHCIMSVKSSYKHMENQEFVCNKSSYKHMENQELVCNKEHLLLVPKPKGNERMRNLFISTRAIAESRRLIEQNELNKAMQLLSSARDFVKQSKLESIEEHANNLEVELSEVQWRMECKQQQTVNQVKIRRRRINGQGVSLFIDDNGESLTPTSAWKAAERLAKMSLINKSFSKVGDLHGFENARF